MPNWITSTIQGGVAISTVTLANGEASDDLDLVSFPEKTLHLFGTFGVGGSVDIQGRNDPLATFQDLHRSHLTSGTFTSLTAELLAGMVENPRFIRATVTAGDVTTSLTIKIVSVTGR